MVKDQLNVYLNNMSACPRKGLIKYIYLLVIVNID